MHFLILIQLRHIVLSERSYWQNAAIIIIKYRLDQKSTSSHDGLCVLE